MIKRQLGFGSMGNGLVVWDRLNYKHGDYETIAHIDASRNIKWYVDPESLELQHRERIEHTANDADPSTSVSQPDIKVFNTRLNAD